LHIERERDSSNGQDRKKEEIESGASARDEEDQALEPDEQDEQNGP
jgi:hypothetical protein